ncbi:MAG: hypothetical protein WBM41_11580 [Arenicellales bacterium]
MLKKLSLQVFAALSMLIPGIALSMSPFANVVFASEVAAHENRVDPKSIKQDFGCGEPVHAVIGLEGLAIGPHDIEVIWLDPEGNALKADKGQVEIPRINWIAYFSSSIMVSADAAASGEGQSSPEISPYSGVWVVEVRSGGESVGRGTFTMTC